jgi:hypothetical protein
MPHAKILAKQALHTLAELHSELAGKLSANQREKSPASREALFFTYGAQSRDPSELMLTRLANGWA